MKKICKIMLLLIISFLFVFGMVNYTSIISKISSQFNIHSNNYNNGNNSNDRIHFINVNHGSAFLIESNGKFGLIDSGYDENAHHLVNYLNAVLPEGKKLDFVLLTHHHEDHAGGFAKVVNAGFVNQNTIFYYKEYTLTDEDRRYILNGNPTCKDDFDSAYIPLVNAQVQLVNLKGQNEEYELNFGGFNIKFLNISKEWTDLENNNSIVTLVTHVTSNKKVLLTGDIQVPAEKWLIEQVNTGKINLGKVDILKPGHHGISTSSCYEFMDLVQPNEMIIDRVNMAYDTNPTSNAAFRYWSKKYLNKEYDEAPIYIDGYATEDGAIIVTFNSNGYNIADSGRKSLEDLRMKSQIMYDDTFLRITNYTDKGVAKNWWYYFDEFDEKALTGLQKINYRGTQYTFYFKSSGEMATGFNLVDGNWRYFCEISDHIEGYTGGAMITGWHNLKYKGIEYTFYFDEDGVMAEGFKKIDNKWYYFSSSVISEIIEGYTGGAMVKGLHQIDNKIYYLADDNDSNGYSIGERYHNICSNINNEYYCFDENGVGDVVTVIEFPTSENYCETLTYTGSEQTLTKTPGSGYIFDGNKGTNAGEYTVTATLESGYRWSDNTTEEKTFKCSIEKATPIITLNPKSVTVVAGGQVTFKEKADVAGSFNNTSGTTNVTTISPATNTNVEANTEITETVSGVSEGSSEISITFTPTDTTNYKNVSKTLIAIVTKNVTIPTSENFCETLIYTGSEQTLTKTPGSGYIFDGNKGTNAGEYTVTATLVSGYRWSDNTTEEKTFKCTIEKAKLSTPQVENYNGEYDGNYHSIMVSPVSIGTIIYSYDNLTWTLNKPMRSDVGTTNVYVKVLGDDNYFDSDTVTSSITITSNFSYLINNYDIDNSNKYISKIVPRTSLETFKNNIELGIGYSVSIDTKNIDEKKLLYTGGKTKIMKDSSVVIEYTNVVIGDINGDAAINSADLLKIRQHLLGTNILTNAYFLSSDINYDNIINSADLLRLRQHLLGTKPIE